MKLPTILVLLLSTVFATQSLAQEEIATKWRGPEGNGVYTETGLLKAWPASGPEIIWSYEDLGVGYSSPVVVANKVYITGMEGETGYVYAFDKSGHLLWKAPYGPEFSSSYPGSRSSVTVTGDLLYMLSGKGQLVCMSTDDGSIKWKKELFRDFDGRNIQWGITETVAVDDKKVYCAPGGRKNNVVALDRFTGDLIWSSAGKGDVSAHCTPLLIDLPQRKILVTMMANNILGLDANTGKLLWSHPQTNQYSIHANTPIYQQGAVFCFSGYGKGGVKLQLSDDGSTATKKWFSNTFNSRTGGAVAVNGYVYGSGDSNREWQCIDWETGQQKYSSREVGNGVVIYADGMLYLYSQRGELALVKPGANGFEVISKTKVLRGSGQHWAHPAIDDGYLYLRHGKALLVYKIS
jgi:outer membrane protein assembly factor BamB